MKPNLERKIVVTIGGGSGQFSLLHGLKQFSDELDIRSIVTMFDSGGSSGELRTKYGILPPGDLVSCMCALAGDDNADDLIRGMRRRIENTPWEKFVQTFTGKKIRHSVGNVLLMEMYKEFGSYERAIEVVSGMLRCRGKVLPVTYDDSHLKAIFEDGHIIEGETHIDTSKYDGRIVDLSLTADVSANPQALEALSKADVIVYGPGDLYTSLVPNFRVPRINEAIDENTNAKRVLVTNIMTKPGETGGYKVSDFVRAIHEYSGSMPTDLVVNNAVPNDAQLLERYKGEGKVLVVDDFIESRAKGIKIHAGDYVNGGDILRHDSSKLAEVIYKITNE